MSKKYPKWKKAFVNEGQPLYTQDDFLYYFEKRLRTIVREEMEVLFSNMFFGAPF